MTGVKYVHYGPCLTFGTR